MRLSNRKNRNISKPLMDFSSRKRLPFFTNSDDGAAASTQKKKKKKSAYFFSVSGLKGIRVKMKTHVTISSEIDILNDNGFWYVAFPDNIQPARLENHGNTLP